MNLIEQDPDNAELYRQKSLLSAEHMLTHLEETLSILRSPSGVEKPEIIHLDKVLEEVKVQIENELLDADIQSNFVALGVFKYPAYHLKSYLLNLLTNAVKYRHSRRKLVIQIGGRKQNDFVYISVSDNGLGIDMEKYGNRIFGFKQRFHDTAASGTGLGLFNLKNQVESLNGKIEVESEIDKGSTFTLCLPDFSL
jgi:signal transduction histidine kinase